MQPTRPWPLLALAAFCAVLAWVIARTAFSSLAPLPWTPVPPLALLAIGEVLTGRYLRARLRPSPGPRPANRRPLKPVQPMAVPRIVALAKASSAAAAIFGGLAFGFGSYAAGSLGKPGPRHDAIVAAVTVVAAAALVLAALYLERSCRAPDPPDDSQRPMANGQRHLH